MAIPCRLRLLVPVTVLTMTAAFLAAMSPPAQSAPQGDDTPVLLTPKGEHENGEDEAGFDKLGHATDDAADADALTVSDNGYKVVFLAFPFEAYGSSAQKADLMHRALTWFGG